MCDEETLEKLFKIIKCLNEIITIKNNIGYIDVGTLLVEPDQPKKLVKKQKKPTTTKHYNHYVDDDYVSGCGGRPNYTTVRKSLMNKSDSSSYSSGCGNSSYTSRC